MNTEPNPLRTPPSPAERLPLDERIRQAEQRLLARQHSVQLRCRALADRWHRATAPRRWVWPLLGLGLSVVSTWRLLRTATAALRRPQSPPWLRLLAVGWPLAERLLRPSPHPPPQAAAAGKAGAAAAAAADVRPGPGAGTLKA